MPFHVKRNIFPLVRLFTSFLQNQAAPRCKTKNRTSLQLFCNCGLSFALAKRQQPLYGYYSCVFLLQSVIRELATIRNRKKVAVLTDFLFSGSKRERLGRHYGRSAQAQHHRAFLRRRYGRVVQFSTANPVRRQGGGAAGYSTSKCYKGQRS